LGKRKHAWQDAGYVLSYFAKDAGAARKAYAEFVKKGAGQGKRPDLIGGGLIRSLGGWKEARLVKRGERIKGDERILGDGGFVESILKEAEEVFERKYRLKRAGCTVEKIERKVLEIFEIDKDELDSGSRKKDVSEARSIFCYLCARELGESMTSLAKRLGLTQPAVGYAVERGKKVAEKRGIDLVDILS
jgi:putative transposase